MTPLLLCSIVNPGDHLGIGLGVASGRLPLIEGGHEGVFVLENQGCERRLAPSSRKTLMNPLLVQIKLDLEDLSPASGRVKERFSEIPKGIRLAESDATRRFVSALSLGIGLAPSFVRRVHARLAMATQTIGRSAALVEVTGEGVERFGLATFGTEFHRGGVRPEKDRISTKSERTKTSFRPFAL
jgi:hypothetical protein